MSFKFKFLILIVLYLIYGIGIWTFFSGYLLKRFAIYDNSSQVVHLTSSVDCDDVTSLRSVGEKFHDFLNSKTLDSENHVENKSQLKRFNKAVIVVIDALRYDFAVYENSTPINRSNFRNNMPIFTSLIENYPGKAMLYHLLADPPTTTFQRLKGITTGSLPTFIDIGFNFASSEIKEDNLLRQLRKSNKNVVFLGDETWSFLFPGHFHRSFPFPSFNVKDLDTVDNGIIEHIYEEIAKDDWDVIIAHFLGVDHCGHRHGPDHPAMSKKLKQLNVVIRNIIKMLSEDTLLVVLGDHGMTQSGDHGGDSTDEVSTALFLYNSKGITKEIQLKKEMLASQKDIVPTFSLLMGIPIPFSNLGSALPQPFVFQHCFGSGMDTLLGPVFALAENSYQVHQYLRKYLQTSQELFPIVSEAEEKLKLASQLWRNLNKDSNHNYLIFHALVEGYKSYLEFVETECNRKWATFNVEVMFCGLLILCSCVILNFLFSQELKAVEILKVTCFVMIVILIGTVLTISKAFTSVILVLTAGVLHQRFKLVQLKQTLFVWGHNMNFPMILVVFIFFSGLSNSFIIHEHSVILFLLQTMIVYRFYPVIVQMLTKFQGHEKSKKNKMHCQRTNATTVVLPLLLICILVCLRLSIIFYKCREDMVNCETSAFLTPLENLDSSFQVARLLMSWISVWLPILGAVVFVKYTMPNNFTVAIICVNYAIVFVSICICLHWWLSIVPPHVVDKILGNKQVVSSQCALTVSSIVFLSTWAFPFLPEKPWEFQMTHIFSSSICLFAFSFLLPLYVIAGDGIAPSLTLFVIATVGFLILHNTYPESSDPWVPTNVIIWGLSCYLWFYGTGHQPTFPSIQWHAAFVINKEVSSYALASILVTMNTFSSHILHGILVPLLLNLSSKDLERDLFKFILMYISFHGLKLLSSVVACFILRRHLMVWAIFTPKLIFETLGIIVTLFTIVLSYMFAIWTIRRFHKLIMNNVGDIWILNNE